MRIPKSIVVSLAAGVVVGIGAIDRTPAASTPSVATVTVPAALANHPGKLLAGNCFQCHGTLGRGGPFESIAGESASELYSEMKSFQGRSTSLMSVHANGYTDAQLHQIADFFSKAP